MIVRKIPLDETHWSSDWVPISYKNVLNNTQYKKSYTFLWSENYKVIGICRSYYITSKRIEIGDVWLNPEYHGKRNILGVKYSIAFMKRVISKIWENYPSAKEISLVVHANNPQAIKLYERTHFVPQKSNKAKVNIKKGIYMVRKKK